MCKLLLCQRSSELDAPKGKGRVGLSLGWALIPSVLETDNTPTPKAHRLCSVQVLQVKQSEIKFKSFSLWKSMVYKTFSVGSRKCFNTTRNGFRDPRPLLPVQRAAHIHMDAARPGSLKVPGENPGKGSAVAPTQEPWRFELSGSCCSASLALPHNTIAFCCVCARRGL